MSDHSAGRTVPWIAPFHARDCACGGVLVVVGPLVARKIENAVRGHQASDRHQSWIQMGGIEAMGPSFRVYVDVDHEIAVIAATLPLGMVG